jgi:trehalose 6-phosphate synthase
VNVDVVLASDRGPIAFSSHAGRLVAERRRGGLVSTLECATRSIAGNVTWIGTTTSDWDPCAANHEYKRLSAGSRAVLDSVYVEPSEYWEYYNDAGVRLLWFAHHDLWQELGEPNVTDIRPLGAYRRVNRLIAERVADECRADSLVLFHDYQLATAPRELASLCPRQPIAHITYTPFGPPESFSRLSDEVVRTVVDGMLGADLVGFLYRRWAEDFLDCCRLIGAHVDSERGIVRHAHGKTWVRCYPLGSDLEVAETAPMVERTDGIRYIMRADRVDPAKNIIRGFQAFELLLERRPDQHEKIIFASYPVPSREHVTEYRSYAQRLAAEVDRINARFPGAIEIHNGADRCAALTALQRYDVLLVNSLRDGMNLLAQEGPLVNTVDGCVVLSAATGSAGILGDDALILGDPCDVVETANLLERALAMPVPERSRRVTNMRAAVQANRPEKWITNQITDLRVVSLGGQPEAGAW